MSKVSCLLLPAFVMLAPMTSARQDRLPVMVAQSDQKAVTISYAAVKRPLRPVTRREALTFLLPGPYPARGVVLAFGSFFSDEGGWTVVDFDARTIERLTTIPIVLPDGKRQAKINNRVGRHLTVGEVNDIIAEGNLIWDPPPRPTSRRVPVLDNTCDVALFDGADVFYDIGMGCPAETESLVKRIDEIDIPPRAH